MAYAVPTDVQAGLAERAAGAGRHLLLEMPIATTVDAADRLAAAVGSAGVTSIVFLTGLFMPERRAWIESVRGKDWYGAWAVARHRVRGRRPVQRIALATREGRTLGCRTTRPLHGHGRARPAGATDRRGWAAYDVVHLVAHHESGVTSTATVTLSPPAAAGGSTLTLWGEPGRSSMPSATTTPAEAYAVAVAELVAGARADRTSHPCGVAFGADVVRLLADAGRQLDG